MVRNTHLKKPDVIKQSEVKTFEFDESIINTVHEPLVILNEDLRVIKVSRSFYEVFKVKPEETVGKLIYDIGYRQWDIPKLRELLETILPQRTTFDNYEVEHDFRTIGRRIMVLNARKIQRALGKDKVILLAIEDITDRRQAEKVLAEKAEKALSGSEEKYRMLVENINDVLYMLDTQGNVTYISPAVERVTKYKVNDIIGKSFIPLIYPDDIPGLLDSLNRLESGQLEPWEFRIVDKDGTIKFMRSSSQPIYENGQIVGFTALMVDITEHKKAEKTIVQQREEYRTIFDAAQPMIVYLDKEGVIQRINKSGADTFGREPKEIIGKTMYDFFPAAEADHFAAEDNQVIASGKPLIGSISEYTLPTGQKRWAQVDRIPYRDEHGDIIGVIILSHDITERRLAEGTLRESEEKYRLLAENARDIIWTMDMNLQFTYMSPSVLRIRGYTVEEVMAQSLEEVFTSSSLEIASKAFAEELALENMEPKDLSRMRKLELEHTCKDGSTVWVEVNTSFLRDTDGQPIGILGVSRDITEHKKAEKTIVQQREEYRTIFDGVRPLIAYLDNEGVIQRINKSGSVLVNRDPKEVVGKTMYDFFPAAEADKYQEADKQVIDSRKPLIGLISEYTRPSGQKRWTQIDRIPYFDENGDMIGIIVFAQDITRRKMAEEKLEKSYESLKKTLDDAIDTMAKIVETRDPYTAGHQHKVADLAIAIAREMKLEDTRIDQLRMAAIIHDIGKMYIPSDILSKPGKLSNTEFELIKTHPQSGYDIVKGMDFPCNIAKIVLQHHERLDGSGYPNQLKGEDMILEAKILAVADVVEAMVAHRPYRPALGLVKALEEISKNKGKLYDPDVVDACLELFGVSKFVFKSV